MCAVAGVRCSVVGVPKTIDGDLKNDAIAVSFGFDTACKVCMSFQGLCSRAPNISSNQETVDGLLEGEYGCRGVRS